MKKQMFCMVAMLACAALVCSGCETYGQGAGLGSVLGAGAGALVGSASGHAGEGALIGAGVGAIGGLIAHDVKARKAKDKAATATQYNYQPAQGEMLTLENSQVLPSTVARGNLVEASIQYALLGAGGGVSVRETRALRQGDNIIAEVSSKNLTRDDGTWVSTQQIKIPENLQAGTYSVAQTVETAKSRISSATQFTVQ